MFLPFDLTSFFVIGEILLGSKCLHKGVLPYKFTLTGFISKFTLKLKKQNQMKGLIDGIFKTKSF